MDVGVAARHRAIADVEGPATRAVVRVRLGIVAKEILRETAIGDGAAPSRPGDEGCDTIRLACFDGCLRAVFSPSTA